MFLVQILFLCILILAIARTMRISFVESLPIGVSLLILLLYGLAFFRGLPVSDYIALGTVAAVGIAAVSAPSEKRREIAGFVKKELLSPATITMFFLAVTVTVCVSAKVTSWWDDYNFWATDAKSLFYLNGFAGKYSNAAAEFGDYPPGTQLMKWWFLHFSPDKFREGLMFAGYYFMNLAFLSPLLGLINKKKPLLVAAGGLVLWLFPAVAEAFWMDGTCADLTMALVYGAFLTSVVDGREKGCFFYYGRQTLLLMILVLCKNTGFIWVAFGLIFAYGYHLLMMKEQKDRESIARKKDRWGILAVTLLPVLTEGSWLLFCLSNRRVAKLTGTAIKMATGNLNLPEYQGAMVEAFIEAFLSWPLHRSETWAIDLSPLALYLLLPVFSLLLLKLHKINKKQAFALAGFFAVSGVVFYAFNLVSHLTIFAIETQYLEPYGMISSIERYGAPFTIGGLYLLAYLTMRKGQSAKAALVCMAFVLLTTDYAGAYRAIWGYQKENSRILAERNEIVDARAEHFLEVIGSDMEANTGRVLYLRDVTDASWVRNTYIGFEAAPVPVMHGNIDADSVGTAELTKMIEEAHASYLYVDELAGDGQLLFGEFSKEPFAYCCLYQVIKTETGMKLQKCSP